MRRSSSVRTRWRVHFSQKVGWNNDPNGMVWHEAKPSEAGGEGRGKWHLFPQHNPTGRGHANMTWGHSHLSAIEGSRTRPVTL
jgi:fructan beta-fructosidase